MHIAVCDDNVADRKQMERLLGRESDKRKTVSGAFYTDSYGNPDALCANPMSYDLFFIDLTLNEPNGLTIARRLRALGVTAPIVLCSSRIDYPALMAKTPDQPCDFLHLQKPVLVAELSKTLDEAAVLCEERVPTIELRANAESYYVLEDDIMYAVSVGRYVHVSLRNGRKVCVLTSMLHFYDEIYMFSHLLMLSQKALINITHLASYSAFGVVMNDGTRLKSSPSMAKEIKNALLAEEAGTL